MIFSRCIYTGLRSNIDSLVLQYLLINIIKVTLEEKEEWMLITMRNRTNSKFRFKDDIFK